MKVDLVMWAKNGEWCLDRCLKSINKAIPEKNICHRILVDDQSTDNTPTIARKNGWEVVPNKGSGIGDGANTALSYVDTEYYCSFEQDVILHPDWWKVIPKHLTDPQVVAAQGLRLPNIPVLRKFQEYRVAHSPITHSIDNTIYKTEKVKELGGYPKLPHAGVDSVLVLKVLNKGLKWVTDHSIVSIHLRRSIWQDIRRSYVYGLTAGKVLSKYETKYNAPDLALRVLFSPIRGLYIAFMKKAPLISVIYPLMRINAFKGFSQSMRNGR